MASQTTIDGERIAIPEPKPKAPRKRRGPSEMVGEHLARLTDDQLEATLVHTIGRMNPDALESLGNELCRSKPRTTEILLRALNHA